MVSDSAEHARPASSGRAFWWRLSDNFFRHLLWYLLPVLALGALGVSQAANTPQLYRSTGTISASTNPLLPEQPVSGVYVSFWETPAGATSRIIGERIQTNSFLAAVAERAGLADAIESGLLDLGVVRASVWAAANGNSILTVNAQWADPATSRDLVAAVIDEYETFLTEALASDAAQAEAYYTEQRERLVEEEAAARRELRDFSATLEPLSGDDRYPLAVELELDRLSAAVTNLGSKIAAAEDQVDQARVQRSQQAIEAAGSFTVIDEPQVPATPESRFVKRGMTVISFALMGVAVSVGALLLTTALDHSVASPADLTAVKGVTRVVTVPPLQLGTRRRGRQRRRLEQSW